MFVKTFKSETKTVMLQIMKNTSENLYNSVFCFLNTVSTISVKCCLRKPLSNQRENGIISTNAIN